MSASVIFTRHHTISATRPDEYGRVAITDEKRDTRAVIVVARDDAETVAAALEAAARDLRVLMGAPAKTGAA